MRYLYTVCVFFLSTLMLAQNASNIVPNCAFYHSNMAESIDSIITDMSGKSSDTYALHFYSSGQTDKMEIITVDAAVLLDSASGKNVVYMNETLADTIMGVVTTGKHLILILGEKSFKYVARVVKSPPSFCIIPYRQGDAIGIPVVDDRVMAQKRRVYRVKPPQFIQTYPMRITDDL